MQPLKTTLTAFHNVHKIIKTVSTRVYHRGKKTVEAEFSQCLNDWQQLWYPDCSLVLVGANTNLMIFGPSTTPFLQLVYSSVSTCEISPSSFTIES